MKPSPKPSPKTRIDQLLVQQGLAPSRERAQALVLAGKVLVNDHRVNKPSESFRVDEIQIRLKGRDHPFVGRGALKLQGAVEHFNVSVAGKTCLDIGASTGGFTDYLLQNGATKVYTFDSGTNQLHFKIRQDPRVIARENYNVRFLTAEDVPEKINLIVVDVSFISLKLILPALLAAIPGPWEILALIKPQFEAGPQQVEKGGIVRDPKVREAVVEDVKNFTEAQGLQVLGVAPSVLQGDKGNQEYFLFGFQQK